MSGLGSYLNVRFGSGCFFCCLLWEGWSGSGFLARSYPCLPQPFPRETDLRGGFSWGFRFCDGAPASVEAGDLARAMEDGHRAVPIFENPDGGFDKMMPVRAWRDLQVQLVVGDAIGKRPTRTTFLLDWASAGCFIG